jgi:CubicO group peptidase (beta-lactamase class C family)
MRSATTASFLACLLTCPPAPAATPPAHGVVGKGLEAIDAAMMETIEKQHFMGASVALAKDGRLVFARGYGWADYHAKRPMRPATPVNLASVSKALTGVAILRLADEGKLRLDDGMLDLLGRRGPGLNPRLKEVTPRMLLFHTSGWAGGKDAPAGARVQERDAALGKGPLDTDQVVRFLLAHPPETDPGTHAHYSNLGYMAAGAVIARVTGESYAEAVQENVLRPLGIRHVRLGANKPDYLPREARRYVAGQTKALPGGTWQQFGPAGGWVASSVDMARFLTGLTGSRTGKPFLSKRMMDEMVSAPPGLKTRPDGSHFGLGWDKVWKEGERYGWLKNGGTGGISTMIIHRPDGLDIVVLVNSGNGPHKEKPAVPPEARFVREIQRLLPGVKEWPDADYFKDFE